MDPIGTVLGLGLGALAALLLPLIGLGTLIFVLTNKRTRRHAKPIIGFAAATMLLLAPLIPWHPAQSLDSMALTLSLYFLMAVPVWTGIIYVWRWHKPIETDGA